MARGIGGVICILGTCIGITVGVWITKSSLPLLFIIPLFWFAFCFPWSQGDGGDEWEEDDEEDGRTDKQEQGGT